MKTLIMKIAHSSKVIHNAPSLGGTRCKRINYICVINGHHITNLSKPSSAKQQREIIGGLHGVERETPTANYLSLDLELNAAQIRHAEVKVWR